MGHEKWYVALPANCDLIAKAIADPEFGENLGRPSIFAAGGVGWKPWDEPDKAFWHAVQRLNKEHPGLKNRVCSLDRSYDMLHYLLSTARRRGEYDYTEWETQAIRGALALPGHLQGGQGHPIRYSPPDAVQEIAHQLGGVAPVSLRQAYDPLAMEEQAVYKNDPEDNGAEEGSQWEYICTYFAAWKTFYLEVARHVEGVLVITT